MSAARKKRARPELESTPVQCAHNRTRDGGSMFVDPTVCCLDCGHIRKWISTTWSDGSPA